MNVSLKHLMKGASVYSISNILTKAGAFLLIPIYVRYLTPEQYGILGVLTAIINILSLVLVFGLYGSQIRYYSDLKGDTKKIGSYIFSINITLVVFLSLVFLFFFSSAGQYFFGLIISNNKITFYPYVAVVLGIVFFSIIRHMAKNYFVASQNFKTVALISILSFILSSIFALYFVIVEQMGALGKFLGTFAGTFLIAIPFYILYLKDARFHFDTRYVKDSFAIGMPLMMSAIVGTIIATSDRIILNWFVSLDNVGIYTLAYSLSSIIMVLIASFNSAWMPNFFDMMKTEENRDYNFRRIFYIFFTLLAGICLFGQLFAKEIITILMPPSYHPSFELIPIILFGLFLSFIYYYFANSFIFYKRTRSIPIILSISAFANIGLNLVLIPEFGVIAAAYSTVIAYIIGALLIYAYSTRTFNLPEINRTKILFTLVILFNPLLLVLSGQIGITYLIIKIVYMGVFTILIYDIFREYLDDPLSYFIDKSNTMVGRKK